MIEVIAKIRSRYRLALLAIAILSTAAALILQFFLSIQKTDAHVINIAGKQRMLSQKIAWHVNVVSQKDDAQHRHSLEQAVTAFKKGHNFLLQTNAAGEYVLLNDALKDYYFLAPNNLAQHSELFIAAATAFVQSDFENDSNIPDSLNIKAVELLLKKLDHAVGLFEHQSNNKVTMVSNIELGVWLFTLLLLLVELRFIFKPMEKHIKTTLDKYQKQKQHAESLSQNKQRFIARAGHELRTPLQGLLNAVEQLEASDAQNTLQQQAHYCSHRLLNILDELNEVQQMSLGQWTLVPSKANLRQSLDTVIQSYQFACQEKGLILEKHLADSLDCMVELDHRRFQQVVSELISNALKFTESGKITIEASITNNQQLKLIVADTGIGFKNYYPYLSTNEHTQQDNHFQGMQVGLARVQHILQMQQGHIEFSENEPHGACINVLLPIAIQQPQTQQPLPTNLHCLIVEDNPLNAMILKGILKEIGYTNDLAENGLIATAKAEENSYDLVFMDLNMPVMDGFKAIEVIRQELNLTMPIIVVTANMSQTDIDRTVLLGANAHVFKPINLETIKKALTDTINKG